MWYLVSLQASSFIPPSGKHKHRGGGALPGRAHPEQRGEPDDREGPEQPGSVRVHKHKDTKRSSQLLVVYEVVTPDPPYDQEVDG